MEQGKLMDVFYEKVIEIMDEIRSTEREPILRAARVIAEHVKQDKIVYVLGTGGHSNLGALEMFVRAGGLMHVSAILNQETMLHSGAMKSMSTERLPGYGRVVVEDYAIGEGDLLLICNAYGINSMTIDAALTAKEHGATVIGVSSHEHANTCPPDHPARHPSKQNLHDIVDYPVDCKMKLGDAVIELEGCPQKIGAMSTFANAYVIDSIVVEAIGMLVRDGVDPAIWRSGNCPGGDEWNNQFLSKFRGRIRCL